MLADAQQELSAYGDPMYDTKSGQVKKTNKPLLIIFKGRPFVTDYY